MVNTPINIHIQRIGNKMGNRFVEGRVYSWFI